MKSSPCYAGCVAASKQHLFIYGTLKRGDVRAPLLAGQAFLGEVRTAPRYRLFNTGSYPAMVEAEALGLPGLAVVGELWAVDAEGLVRLDEEEAVDEGLYKRRMIEMADHRAEVQAYLYLQSVEGMPDCGDCWRGAC